MEMLCDNQQLDVLEAALFMVACAERKIISRVGNCWHCWNLICSCSHDAYGCLRGAQNDIMKRMLMLLLENDMQLESLDCRRFSAGLPESIAIVMEMLCDNQQLDVLEAALFMVACAERKIISRVENCWCCSNTICSCGRGAYGCLRGAQNDITNRRLLMLENDMQLESYCLWFHVRGAR
ncbi:hypothetical protein TTRE_0000062101 [Trichuris trichiura]|uniref:Uncharacterized protein n=1 Tax=Trichuris trichiura TaxID=36087 RepID=A0A077YWE5_TRITR|nr:hypothetical protein TTRE_0000062101 [Trichuris trichiura]